MEPVVITAALVGAELSREQTPYLPLTPVEIATAAEAAAGAGASLIHLHVRDEAGRPTLRLDILSEVTRQIQRRCPGVIVQLSTGGAVGDSFEARLRVLELKPEMASLNVGTMNFGDEVFANPRSFVTQVARVMRDRGIRPEIEIYDLSHMEAALEMIAAGLIVPPAHFQFVLGVDGGLKATEENLGLLVARVPSGSTWKVAGIGRHEFPMAELAFKMGGHVRVGLEDNIYIEKGVLAKGSHELVARVVALARPCGRRIASIEEARQLLCLASASS